MTPYEKVAVDIIDDDGAAGIDELDIAELRVGDGLIAALVVLDARFKVGGGRDGILAGIIG